MIQIYQKAQETYKEKVETKKFQHLGNENFAMEQLKASNDTAALLQANKVKR